MDKAKEHLAESAPVKGGVARDFQRIKEDGGASLAELREFVGRMHGKSPQEMLGVLAKSRLTISIAFSTAAFLALLFVGTIGPYAWNVLFATPRQPAATASSSAPAKKPAAKTAKPKVAANDAGTNPKSKANEIAKRLGIKEVKKGVPNIENLLDGDK